MKGESQNQFNKQNSHITGDTMAAPARICHYVILEVERDADDAAIKKAYRRQALKWHPDKNEDSKESIQKMQLIQNAWGVLSDRNERQWYDDHRESILRGGDGTSGRNADGSSEDAPPELFQYFSASAYTGFGDDAAGFFGLYKKVFEDVRL